MLSSSPPVDVLDHRILARLRTMQLPGEPDFLVEMIGIFMCDAPPTFERARRAVDQADPAEYREAVHHLKSTSNSLGACRLAACCHEIETYLQREQPAPAFAAIGRLEAEYRLAVAALNKEIPA
jgi:two-component system, sensor histidine kinase RpfC